MEVPKIANGKEKHPTYLEMVKEAISFLNDRKGSSRQAIYKYIKINFTLTSNEKHMENNVKLTLVRGVKSGYLQQTSGVGVNGSFKVNKVSQDKKKSKKSKSDIKEAPKKIESESSKTDKPKKQPKIAKEASEPKEKIHSVTPEKKKKVKEQPRKKLKMPKKLGTPVKSKNKKDSTATDGNLIKKQKLWHLTPARNSNIRKVVTPKKVVFNPKLKVKSKSKLVQLKKK